MVPPFDILRVLKDGAPLCMEAIQKLEEAKARVQQLAATEPGRYVISVKRQATKS
jgi:exonuclease VII small subunit